MSASGAVVPQSDKPTIPSGLILVPVSFTVTAFRGFLMKDRENVMGLEHVRPEIEYMRVQVSRQRRDILQLQRYGDSALNSCGPTGSIECTVTEIRKSILSASAVPLDNYGDTPIIEEVTIKRPEPKPC